MVRFIKTNTNLLKKTLAEFEWSTSGPQGYRLDQSVFTDMGCKIHLLLKFTVPK